MAIQQKSVQYAKEADDVLHLLVELIKGIKAKQDLVSLGSALLPALIEAVSNANDIASEIKSRKVIEDTVALRVSEIVDLFVG